MEWPRGAWTQIKAETTSKFVKPPPPLLELRPWEEL